MFSIKSFLFGDPQRDGFLKFISSLRSQYQSGLQQRRQIDSEINSLSQEFLELTKGFNDEIKKGGDVKSIQSIAKRSVQRFTENKSQLEQRMAELDKVLQTTRFSLNESVSTYSREILKGDEKPMRYEKYLKKHSLDRTRETMPQIDSDEDKQSIIDHFEDKVGVKRVKMKVSQLKPAQNEIHPDKVLSIMASEKKTDEVFISSKDKYLVDGTHRWASELEVDPNKMVDVIIIDLPITQLLKRMNQMKVTGKRDIDDNSPDEDANLSLTSLVRKLTAANVIENVQKIEKQNDGTFLITFDSEVDESISSQFEGAVIEKSEENELMHHILTIVKGYDEKIVPQAAFDAFKETFGLTDKAIDSLRQTQI